MKKIAVINLGPIGDVINSSPVCIELKANYPDAELVYFTIPESNVVAGHIPGVNRVVIYDKKNEHKGFFKLAKFAIFLGFKERFSLAVVLNETFRGAMLAFLLGAKKRIGRASQGRSFLLTKTISFTNEEKVLGVHATEHYMRVLKLINHYNPDQKTGFSFSSKDKFFVDKFLTDNNYNNYELIGLCPCAKINNRDWKPEEAAKFINFINQDSNKKVVIIGTEMAGDFARNLRELGIEDFIDMSCKTTLPQLAALISKFKTFVSVDTGPMHLGLALKIPTVSIFIQANHKKWGPKDLTRNRLLFKHGKITTGEEVIEAYIDLRKSLNL